jgi:hypothetical protein
MESPMLTPNKRRKSSEVDTSIARGKRVELASKAVPLFGYLRCSLGAGVSVGLLNCVRLEASCAMPVHPVSKHDTVKKFQLGVAITVN